MTDAIGRGIGSSFVLRLPASPSASGFAFGYAVTSRRDKPR